MVYADEILDYSGQRKTGVLAGSYGPSADVSPEAGGTITVPQLTVNEKGLITGAVERTVTLPSGGGGGGGGSEWLWDPTPLQTITLENSWYDDTEDGPYGYAINLTGQNKRVLIDIMPANRETPVNGSLLAQATVAGIEGATFQTFGVTVEKPLSANNGCTARIVFAPLHGLFDGYGKVPSDTALTSGPIFGAYSTLFSGGVPQPFFDTSANSYISQVELFPSSNMLPAGTVINVYVPAS